MRVRNVHSRAIARPLDEVGALLGTLASNADRLWPAGPWPPMKLDRPLGPGACGGHGPIRYCVEKFEPGSRVRFRFTAPRGFNGYHEFSVAEAPAGCVLSHTIEMETTGLAVLSWPVIIRPLHDALIEDAFTKAQLSLHEKADRAPWPLRVRMLRSMFRMATLRMARRTGGGS